MTLPLSAPDVLDREFLEVRAKVLEVAATMDRLDRADGSVDGDPRVAKVRDALRILLDQSSDRAEQIQLLFSREYEDDWREQFDLPVV